MWFRQQTASWQDAAARAPQAGADAQDADEQDLQRNFWRKIGRVAASLPFAEDLLAAHYCAFDRRTPLQVKAVLLGAIAYFVLPTDLIPDYLPVIGYADDAAVLAAAIKLVTLHITSDHREAAQRALARLRGDG